MHKISLEVQFTEIANIWRHAQVVKRDVEGTRRVNHIARMNKWRVENLWLCAGGFWRPHSQPALGDREADGS